MAAAAARTPSASLDTCKIAASTAVVVSGGAIIGVAMGGGCFEACFNASSRAVSCAISSIIIGGAATAAVGRAMVASIGAAATAVRAVGTAAVGTAAVGSTGSGGKTLWRGGATRVTGVACSSSTCDGGGGGGGDDNGVGVRIGTDDVSSTAGEVSGVEVAVIVVTAISAKTGTASGENDIGILVVVVAITASTAGTSI